MRVTRELAHRRLVLSVLRRVLRLATLHALDAIAIGACVWLAARLSGIATARDILPALVIFVLLGLNVRGSYKAGPARRDSQRLVTGVLIATVLAATSARLSPALDLPIDFFFYFAIASIGSLILERQLVDLVVHQAYVRGFGIRRALLVSRGLETASIIEDLRTASPANTTVTADDQVVIGYVTPDDTREAGSLGTVARLDEILDAQGVSEVVVATSLSDASLARLAGACFERGVRVFVIAPAVHRKHLWTEITHVGGLPAYHLHPRRLELPALLLKRFTDLVLATLGLLIAAPFMIFLAVAIKLETRGPVFFRQRRVGLGGRPFMMWKFRSMIHEAESHQAVIAHLNPYSDGRLFKLADDPRITRIGRFLRRFSLDELPQLFNVLAGDMSLVGPRPPLPSEVNAYESRHLVRLSVVPGLTGPWQVNGRNLITDFEEVVRLERLYIEGWSLRSDLGIMLRTLGVVISGKGAY